MSPEIQRGLEWLGSALAGLLTGAGAGRKMAQREIAQAPAATIDPALVESMDSRIESTAEDVVRRSHDFKQNLQTYELTLHKFDKDLAKLEGRVERAEADVRELKATFLSEFRRLEDTLAVRFTTLERKVDRITPRSGGLRRSTDDEEE